MGKSTADYFFERYASPAILSWLPPKSTDIIVVLPSYKEEKTHLATMSLATCGPPSGHVVVLVVINQPEESSDKIRNINLKTEKTLMAMDLPAWMSIRVVNIDLPTKKAGVGLARKIGMDQAARWFLSFKKNGIILWFDADSTCSSNYLVELEKAYQLPETQASICYYEHPINYHSGVIDYELHLRYYIDALRYADYPHAFQTLGSCISVNMETYIRIGGMNTRKAGEDFYFLHKIASISDPVELNNTAIYPSDRISDRVPFGTGKSLADFQLKGEVLTYELTPFTELKEWFAKTEQLYQADITPLNSEMESFLKKNDFQNNLFKIRKQATSMHSFYKRYYQWWNGLRVLKYIHFRKNSGIEMIPPDRAIAKLNGVYWQDNNIPAADKEELLIWIRQKDRSYSK